MTILILQNVMVMTLTVIRHLMRMYIRPVEMHNFTTLLIGQRDQFILGQRLEI